MVESIIGVAAAAFCPVILNAHPAMFGLDDFTRLEQRLDHERTFEGVDYLKWRALRDRPDARFVGMTLPRVLMRAPYEDEGDRVDRFRFHEDVRGANRSKYLWGGAGYAFGAVLMRAFAQATAAESSNYRFYISTGSRHTIWGNYKLYTDTTGGVPRFVDWVRAMLDESADWVNVECEDCGTLLPGDPRPNPAQPPFDVVGPTPSDQKIVCD